jgi:hypothetical protein
MLLRLYPAAYREQRGAEMLATLLEAAESGRPRPARREVAGLIVGALRARTGVPITSSRGQIRLSALRVAALLLVAHGTARRLAYAGLFVSRLPTGHAFAVFRPGDMLATIAGALALVAIARGRYRWGLVLTALAFVCVVWATPQAYEMLGESGIRPVLDGLLDAMLTNSEMWPFPLAALCTIPLLAHPPAPLRRPLTWLLAIPLAVLLLPTWWNITDYSNLWTQPAVAVACLMWTVIDPRAPIAAAALLLGSILPWAALYLGAVLTSQPSAMPFFWFLLPYLILMPLLVVAGTMRIHREARL